MGETRGLTKEERALLLRALEYAPTSNGDGQFEAAVEVAWTMLIAPAVIAVSLLVSLTIVLAATTVLFWIFV